RRAGGSARPRGDRRGRPPPGGADPAQPHRQRNRPRREQARGDPDGRRRGHRRGHGARFRGRSAARRGEAGVQPLLALGPGAGQALGRHRAGPGDQCGGRPVAPGPARGVGRARQGRMFPVDAAIGPWPQGDDEPAALETAVGNWGAQRQRAPHTASARAGGKQMKRHAAIFRLACTVCAVAVVGSGCAGVPSSSAPQAIGTVERSAAPSLPKPNPGMDPDVLLREFLKATADPANRHLAARQFLTDSASSGWDDAGSSLLIDNVVFVETRSADRVSVNMHADILGSLSDIGVFETGEGALPDPGPIELVKTSGGWRIDKLPNGVFLDWQQFQETYKRHNLYFADPTGKTVVPDPRYVAVSDPDQLATELKSKLIAGPRPEMGNSVRNMLGSPLRLRGPVTRADGGKTGIGKGYGGARVELEGLSTTDPHSRQLVAAQIIWTLARADISGPYVINADGAPLDDRFANGWEASDVASTDPGADDGAAAGLHA